jgi:photosystem II stability/assembly factor-like uncharacterized protein
MNRRAIALSALLLLAPLARPALAGAQVWTRVGPDEGRVRTLAAAPSLPSTVYAGLGLGGAFRSLDGGTTWSFAGAGLDLQQAVRALIVDSRRPEVLWLGTEQALYRSGNGGATWILGRRGGVSALVQNPASGLLYAGSYPTGLMLRSVDGGVSWQALAGSPQSVLALAIDPVQPQVLYAGSAKGLFKSVNGGASWARLTHGLPNGSIGALAVDPRSRAVYAATSSGVPGQIVFRSDDEGEHWTSVDGGMLKRTSALAVDAGRKGTVWAVSSGQLFRSSDRGRTWKEADDTEITADGLTTVLPGAATLLAGTSFGVFQSRNQGTSWSLSNQGLQAATISGLALDPLQPLRLYAVTTKAYRTATGGAHWSRLTGTPFAVILTGPLAADPHRPGTAYLGEFSGVGRTTDAGNHWSSASLSCLLPRSIAVDPLDSSVVYVAGVFAGSGCAHLPGACASLRSDDAGQSWACIQIGRFLAPDPLQASRVYALEGFSVNVSEDRGASWSFLASGVNFSVLVPDPQRPGTLWAGGPDGLFRSDDGGRTWTPAGGGIPSSDSVTAVVLDPVDKDILYVATLQNGVFKSADGGATWDALGTGLTGVNIRFLVIDPRTRTTLYAGTDAAGVMKLQQPGD